MAQDELQVDVGMLNKFASLMGGASTSGGAAGGLAGDIQKLPSAYSSHPLDQVNFGQTDPHGNSTGFIDAENLHMAYKNQHDAIIANSDGSFSTFVSQLNALADAAATIAKRYQDAATEDVVQAGDVDNLLNTIPSPSQPT